MLKWACQLSFCVTCKILKNSMEEEFDLIQSSLSNLSFFVDKKEKLRLHLSWVRRLNCDYQLNQAETKLLQDINYICSSAQTKQLHT